MKRLRLTVLFLALMVLIPICEAQSGTILLDAETPETGTNLDTAPLVTQYGTITYNGWIGTDITPYISNLAFEHDTSYSPYTPYAEFIFSFDVDSITFNFGGLGGGIWAHAYDINGTEVDSFQTASPQSYLGPWDPSEQPVVLSGLGIRRFTFVDGRGGGFSAIDNVNITTSVVPEPISSTLFIVGGATLGIRRFSKKRVEKEIGICS